MEIKVLVDQSNKEVNVDLQKWESEGGHPYENDDNTPENTPGLLKDGQKFEVLDTHLEEKDGQMIQVVEIKPLNAEKRI